MYRFFIVLISLIIIFLLSLYNFNKYDRDFFQQKKRDSIRVLSGLGVAEINSNYIYAFNHFDTAYIVNYKNALDKSELPSNGDLISIRGINIGKDSISATFIHIHKNRPLKIYLSLIPFFLLVFLFFKYFKFDLKKFIFIKRNA